MALVEFRDVSCSLGGRPVLRGLSFQVDPGETLVLLGRSGSGKTTALRLINAMLAPDAGEVLVEGRATSSWDPIALRRRTGYVIQEGGLFPHFTVAENVGLIPRLAGWDPPRIRARVDELLERVGLPPRDYAARRPRELSGGQRQRVGVARALAADPPILLFDEPFGALDPVTRADLQREFRGLSRDLAKACVFVTHDISEALRLATRIGMLRAGELETLATPAEFRRAATPEAAAFLSALSEDAP